VRLGGDPALTPSRWSQSSWHGPGLSALPLSSPLLSALLGSWRLRQLPSAWSGVFGFVRARAPEVWGPPLLLEGPGAALGEGKIAGCRRPEPHSIAELRLGEEVAIAVLEELRLTGNEQFQGWSLPRFDGRRVLVG